MIGKTLAHFKIIALIGKGGMGEVYRARDTKLDRDVALKMLPPELGHDPERKARFEREARTLASLQHANIASIYGFEEVDGHRFLVMELVEGNELTELIARGPLPVDQALEISLEIARGLEAAHDKGIVHRDLKPANVKIGSNGDVKILDFGLARAYAEEPDPADLDNSPTITSAMTRAGVILGTAAYMSPEQARGRAVDKRTDIWSFGVVLYEMLTADSLFGGETISDSIGAILHRDPDFDALPPVPRPVHRLLERCLERDPRKRLRDIGDAVIELEEAVSSPAAARPQPAVDNRPNRLGWIVASVLAVAVAVLGWMALQPAGEVGPGITSLGLPEDTPIDPGARATWIPFDISPDGKQVVYVGGRYTGLYLRRVDSFEATRLEGTEGAVLPVFSPDGRWIAYYDNVGISKVAVSGGAPIEVFATTNGPALAWRREDILFSPSNGGGLWSVPANGGEPKPISSLNPDREETSHRWPDVLPDGRHALITVKTARIATLDDAEISLLDLDSGEIKTLIPGGTNPRYVEPGFIVYARNGQLFAVGFDLATLTVEGTPRPVLDDVLTVGVNGSARYAISRNGTLAYIPGGADMTVGRIDPVWLDRSGRVTPLGLESGMYSTLALSPDGRQLAMVIPAANDKVWVYDLERKTLSRLTSTPGNDLSPVWSPDGASIAYSNDLSGTSDVFVVSADGSETARVIHASEFDEFATSWSPDGRYLAVDKVSSDGDNDIWIVDVQSGEARAFLETPSEEGAMMFSPNGRAVCYRSDVSGDANVYVRPFPGSAPATRISTSNGRNSRWSRDGSELFYERGQGNDRVLMVVAVEWAPRFRAREPEVLLAMPENVSLVIPTMDDTRFIASRFDPERAKQHHIRIVFDWTRQLDRAASRP